MKVKRWLITGGAGFIGSHIVHRLKSMNQDVTVLDNFSAACKIPSDYSPSSLINGSITDPLTVMRATKNIDIVLHQAAINSVPRSIKEPWLYTDVNTVGFANLIDACKVNGVKRFVYASSSSVYGDDCNSMKTEGKEGNVMSPYAASKAANEALAGAYRSSYGMQCLGLRYFNVFGPRQNYNVKHPAVLAKWLNDVINLKKDEIAINGDGSISRDFTYVDNVVDANILAGNARWDKSLPHVYNIGCGWSTSIVRLAELFVDRIREHTAKNINIRFTRPRVGDVPRSRAQIQNAVRLGYEPKINLEKGLDKTILSFLESHS